MKYMQSLAFGKNKNNLCPDALLSCVTKILRINFIVCSVRDLKGQMF